MTLHYQEDWLHLNSRLFLCVEKQRESLYRCVRSQGMSQFNHLEIHTLFLRLFIFRCNFWRSVLIDTFIWSTLDSHITVYATRLMRDKCMLWVFMSFPFLASRLNRALLSYLSKVFLDFWHIPQYNSQPLNTGHFKMIIYSYCAMGMCLFCAFHKLGSGDICHSRECA